MVKKSRHKWVLYLSIVILAFAFFVSIFFFTDRNSTKSAAQPTSLPQIIEIRPSSTASPTPLATTQISQSTPEPVVEQASSDQGEPTIAAPLPTAWSPPDALGIEWVEIPAGPFLMGAAEGHEAAAADEKPLHEVDLPSFWISKTEITNAQYQTFIEATGHRLPIANRADYEIDYSDSEYADYVMAFVSEFNWRAETGSYPPGRANHPVVQVSWTDALAFVEWLSSETGSSIALPSEAEWEKAARGVGPPRIYPWGDRFGGTRLNFCDQSCPFDWADPAELDGYPTTSPVGTFPAGDSPYGVSDLSGNVWEWTRSLWGPDDPQPSFSYPYNAKDGRENLAADPAIHRVLRGGSWFNGGEFIHLSNRNWFRPDGRDNSVGFRVIVYPTDANSP